MKTIRYSKERLKSNLRMGLLFICVGILLFIFSFFRESSQLFSLAAIGFGQISVGVFALILHYYERQKQYLTIDNGTMKINKVFFKKKIDLDKVEEIRKFAGDYILRTGSKKTTIYSLIIDKDSLPELEKELKQLNAEWKDIAPR